MNQLVQQVGVAAVVAAVAVSSGSIGVLVERVSPSSISKVHPSNDESNASVPLLGTSQ